MIGNRVKVNMVDGGSFEGTLVKQDEAGVTVHQQIGVSDDRRFIPYARITDILDKGRTYT